VLDVSLPAQIGDSAEAAEDAAMIVRRLMEIGFVAGEGFEIVAEAKPGGDPIAVRVGGSIFALRRREAAMVTVHSELAGGAP
jgi:ferrous iron transport protein A